MRGMDSNHRPVGYEPTELTAALPHDLKLQLSRNLQKYIWPYKISVYFWSTGSIKSMIKVEKKKPIPERKAGVPSKYPFKDLKIGDSFLIPDKAKKNGIYSSLAHFNKGRSNPIKITIRIEGVGLRVWRIANIKKL